MSWIFVGFVPFILLIFLIILFSFVPVGLWISAIAAGVKVNLISLIGMRLRRVTPSRIILSRPKGSVETNNRKAGSPLLAGKCR